MTLESDWEEKWEKAIKNHEEAIKKGTYVGRKISSSKYDGYAHYIVKEELPNGDFKVELLDVWDAYTDSMIEYLDCVLPRRLVINYFKRDYYAKKQVEDLGGVA